MATICVSTPSTSSRISFTDPPVITHMRHLMAINKGAVSLAQGIVHWEPPDEAFSYIQKYMTVNSKLLNAYCANHGLSDLKNVLISKLSFQGLRQSDVMITSGANQAFMNVVLTLVDANDSVVLFKPYYFNHYMALQMTNCAVVLGEVTESLEPDTLWLTEILKVNPSIKMVVVCNPCNPTGVLYSATTMKTISNICATANIWLVVDNTYEYFHYDPDKSHTLVEGDHVVNIFSLSKTYGMMGWRIGYLAYPARIDSQLLKTQDTIAICPPLASQVFALGALQSDRTWVTERVNSLRYTREIVTAAFASLMTDGFNGILHGGSGAIYLWFQLPNQVILNEERVKEKLLSDEKLQGAISDGSLATPTQLDQLITDWLAIKWGVLLIPGSACGMPGHIRVCYANLPPDACEQASIRLANGFSEIRAFCNDKKS